MEIPDNFKGVKSVYGDQELPNLNIYYVIFLFINCVGGDWINKYLQGIKIGVPLICLELLMSLWIFITLLNCWMTESKANYCVFLFIKFCLVMVVYRGFVELTYFLDAFGFLSPFKCPGVIVVIFSILFIRNLFYMTKNEGNFHQFFHS